ncbi:dynamin family protein [Modestobacter sp. URMC 112]
MAERLITEVDALLRAAEQAATTPDAAASLAEARSRLGGPLRLAIAGKVKAGKSTLLNALLSEDLAPTDAGECTRIVTWYHRADQPQAVVHPHQGQPRSRPFDRTGGALEVDLGGLSAAEVDHLEIGWPTQRLTDLTLIDTPGLASLSTDLSAETYRALTVDDDRPAQADAVLYLLRHAHASDIRFLEAFHDDELAHGTPMNAVGVLARADEIGSCTPDAMEVAARVGRRYQREPRLRQLCPVVVPVSGLLGLAGETLREQEHRALADLAAAPPLRVEELLLTADRFASRPSSVPVTELDRRHLLDRLGIFGVRLAVDLLRSGRVRTAQELAAELVTRSGLTRLREVLLVQFRRRAQVLKARSALAALTAVLGSGAVDGAAPLRARAEEVVAGAHAFVEVRLLNQLESGELQLPEARADELARLLGALGHDPATRLDLPPDSPPEDLRRAGTEALARWRRLAGHPLSDRSLQLAAAVAARTVEGLLAELPR